MEQLRELQPSRGETVRGHAEDDLAFGVEFDIPGKYAV
jgi:hypothetical protein